MFENIMETFSEYPYTDLLQDWRLWLAAAAVLVLILILTVFIRQKQKKKRNQKSLNERRRQVQAYKKEAAGYMLKAQKAKEKKKTEKAAKYYLKAAEIGEEQAWIELVWLYRTKNTALALKYLKEAQDRQVNGVYTLVSNLYLKGWLDHPVHLPKAMAYARKAAQNNEPEAAEQIRLTQKAIEAKYAKFLVPLFQKYGTLAQQKAVLVEQRKPDEWLLKLDECAGLLPKENEFYMKNAPDTQHKVDVIRSDIYNSYGEAYTQKREYEKAAAYFSRCAYDGSAMNAYVRALCFYEGIRTGAKVDFINSKEAYELSKYAAQNGYYGAMDLQIQISQLYQKQLEEKVRTLDEKAARMQNARSKKED